MSLLAFLLVGLSGFLTGALGGLAQRIEIGAQLPHDGQLHSYDSDYDRPLSRPLTTGELVGNILFILLAIISGVLTVGSSWVWSQLVVPNWLVSTFMAGIILALACSVIGYCWSLSVGKSHP